MRTPKPLKLVSPEPSEARIQTALMRGLQLRGWLVVRVNSGGGRDGRGKLIRAYIVQGLNAIAGFPDVLALRGRERWIEARLFEVKALGGEVRPAQERFARFAARFGVAVEVVEGWDQMEAVVAASN